VGRHLDEEMHLGAALLDRGLAVGIDDGVRDGAILDDAAIDEHVLWAARRALAREGSDETGHPQSSGFLEHFDQVVALTVQLIQPVAKRRGGWTLNDGAAGARQ